MKRLILYIVLIALTFLAPVRRVNIGDLKPIEVIALSRENDLLCIRTDTDDKGMGSSLESALADMKETSSGVIYLDTAQYLLYTPETKEQVRQLQALLHKKVKVYSCDKLVDLKEAASYLEVHGKRGK